MRAAFSLLVAAFALLACGGDRGGESPSALARSGASSAGAGGETGAFGGASGSAGMDTTTTCGISGVEYRHTLARSRAPIPHDTPMGKDGDLDKWIGGEGVFAVWRNTGAAELVLNGGAAEYSVPQSATSEEHAAAVRDYFVGAGVPVCEIDGVSTLGGGDGVTSIVGRSIAGVRVVDSQAGANLRDDGQSEWESVYWPPIPAETVTAAKELAARVADGSYFALVPSGTPTNGTVSIHHSARYATTPLATWVAYDVVIGDVALELDAQGKVIDGSLPH